MSNLEKMTNKAFRVSSFATVGHLLHVNLKDSLVEHKLDIGRALLEKNKRALAVVNKVNSIDNTFRNFEIEVIARREDCTKSDEELMIVEVNENKCRFEFDFSKVYWNSRLCTEHMRIINKFNKGHDVVFDLFAGVGPFSVPAAKARCMTYANDLNPESVKWLAHNLKRNKALTSFYEITNMDAKDYIIKNLRTRLIEEYKKVDRDEPHTKPKVHILMNLPAIAPTFLPYFTGLLRNDATDGYRVGHKNLTEVFKQQAIEHIVYCYCFLKGAYDDPKAEIRSMIEENFARPLNDDQLIDIFRVRNVAPFKEMYRVEIRLDDNILFDNKHVFGIMRSLNGKTMANGTPKKVTIQSSPVKKRPYDEQDQSTEEDDSGTEQKRGRFGDYSCTIM